MPDAATVVPITLTAAELVELTGYRRRVKQARWLREKLRITPPLRADGLPIVSRAQVKAALAGKPQQAQPKWSKIAA